MKKFRLTIVIGKKGSGKTTALRNILYNTRDRYDIVYGLAPTTEPLEFFREILPAPFVFNTFDLDQLQLFVNGLELMKQIHHDRHGLIIIDDFGYDKKLYKDTRFIEFATNQRHKNCDIIVCLQNALTFPPEVRTNADYIFCTHENTGNVRKKLHEHYFGVIQPYKNFENIFMQCTQNHELIVLDNTAAGSVESSISYFHPVQKEKLPKFRLCKDIYWKLAEKYKRENISTINMADPFGLQQAPLVRRKQDEELIVEKVKPEKGKRKRKSACSPSRLFIDEHEQMDLVSRRMDALANCIG